MLPDTLLDQPASLVAMDLHDQKLNAERASAYAVAALGTLLRSNHRLTLLIEGEVEEPAYQNRALGIVTQNEKAAVEIAELLHELVAQHTALLVMLEGAIRQRDEAINTTDRMYDHLVRMVTENQGCSTRQAEKLMAVITASDQDILEADVVMGAERLDEFRDNLQRLLDYLDEDLTWEGDE